MAFHLRKLLDEYPGIPPGCEPFCLPLNTDGKCPSLCMSPCPFFCKTPTDNNLPPPSPTTTYYNYSNNHPSDHHDTAITVALIAFLLHLFVVIFFIIKRCILQTKTQSCKLNPDACADASFDENHGPNQGPAVEHHVWQMRTAVISEIILVKYEKGDGLIEGTECSVCLNGFVEDETLRLLPECSHTFHVPCVDTWLRSHTNCPLCRASVVSGPSREVIVQDMGPVKENLAETWHSSLESAGESIEDDVNSRNGIRTLRRSVSMNALSGSMVSADLANDSERKADDQMVEVKELYNGIKRHGGSNQLLRLVGSLSTERPTCIKRSLSYNAKV